jgi:coenzyme PQQ precursor peptide PqqA
MNRSIIMAWTTPKIVEISVGLEINSYACAEA